MLSHTRKVSSFALFISSLSSWDTSAPFGRARFLAAPSPPAPTLVTLLFLVRANELALRRRSVASDFFAFFSTLFFAAIVFGLERYRSQMNISHQRCSHRLYSRNILSLRPQKLLSLVEPAL